MLPTGPVMQHDGECELHEITLLIYPGGDSSFTLYEDDGSSNAYLRGGGASTDIACVADEQVVTCSIGPVQASSAALIALALVAASFGALVRPGSARPLPIRPAPQASGEGRT